MQPQSDEKEDAAMSTLSQEDRDAIAKAEASQRQAEENAKSDPVL